jgi:putative aldouronate transport system substrate-binding protein
MRKLFSKKLLSVLLASSMVIGSASALTGCGSKKNEVIKLNVYSQLANFSGKQIGWSADILKKKFNVELNIIPEGDGVFETRMTSGNLGDIVVWGADNDKYPLAVKNNLLFGWEDDNVLDEYGPYIKKNMPDALKKNKELTKTITNGASDKLYGFGANVALNSKDHESFFYTWDTRWDLYKKLGYPKVKNLQDYHKMLKNMQKLCPSDDSGNKVYAVSLWPDWDDAMVMYVKAMATAYYGYDELALGLYDPTNGKYHDALEENGPYLEMLKWFNDLYQDGLIDPDSMTQTYDEMIAKVQNGGTLFSIFNYSGSLGYNTKEHTSAGKLMYCMKPEDASPIVYGMNTQGGDRVWSIGAKTEYPEKCMEIINYLSTPEGRMTMEYGPKGYTWDYDDQKHAYLTDVGVKCQNDKNTTMGGGYKGSYHDGELQINNITWSLDASNPDSDGETYNKESWASYNATPSSDIEKDWRDKTGCTTINEYMEKGKYTVAPGTSFSKETQDTTLKTTWNQVTTEIKNSSWKAIYAKSDKKFDSIVAGMKKSAKKYGYDKCVEWSRNQASRRKALEDAITR